MILAIDPGKDKCGMAVLDESGNVLERKVLERRELLNLVLFFISKYPLSIIVIGRSVFGKEAERELIKLDLRTGLIFIPEKDSTLQARQRYWKETPPPAG